MRISFPLCSSLNFFDFNGHLHRELRNLYSELSVPTRMLTKKTHVARTVYVALVSLLWGTDRLPNVRKCIPHLSFPLLRCPCCGKATLHRWMDGWATQCNGHLPQHDRARYA